MNAVDTNVLIYAHDTRDPIKKALAQGLIQSLADGVLPWQVICEYLSASRKLEPLGYSRAQAWSDIRTLRQLWIVLLPNWNVVERAEQITQKYSLSIWDSLLVALCLEGGVTRWYSEDITGYPKIESLELVNPFVIP